MPRVVNKSARIFHFNNGMCAPNQEAELDDKEFNSKYVQSIVEAGDLVEPREAKKQATEEQKAADAAAKAQAAVAANQPRKV